MRGETYEAATKVLRAGCRVQRRTDLLDDAPAQITILSAMVIASIWSW